MNLRERIANVGFTPLTAKALTGALSEIITNVWLHAQTPTPVLVAYQLEQERVFLTVADSTSHPGCSLHRYRKLSGKWIPFEKQHRR
jgi:anti-sigma regulatory factor (Ser/Thr protein kinase)